jgi:subfamily B ATP-binding cassette protein MsbA
MVLASAFTVVPPWLLKNVVDDVLIQKNMMVLNILAVGLVLLFVGKAVASYGHQYLMNWVGQHVVMDLRVELYQHMQKLSMRYIYGKRVGELMSRITNDVMILQNMVTTVVVDLVVQGVTFLGMLSFMVYINWKLTLLTFAVLPLVALLLSKASSKLRVVGHDIQEQLAMLSATAQEALSAVRIVLSFATEEEEAMRFREQNLRNFRALMKRTQLQAALSGIIEVVLIASLALILWVGGREVVMGNSTPGELIAFLGYLGFLVQPIRVYTRVISNMQHGLAACDRIFALLDTPVEVTPPENPIFLPSMKGKILFQNVWFSYEPDQWILKGIDLEIKPGEKVAVVGPTGAGKSTLMDFIPRFYDPQIGKVLIDGRDIKALDIKTIRKQIGIVPQDPVLMKGSIAFNISYGMSDATPEQIRNAAAIAGIEEFIEQLPQGYDTEIGERGVTLSGGQRQRIAIARAIIRDPRILIMDEATSSLDMAVERKIQDAMEKAARGRTSLIIAHRLSTIKDADRIVVVDGGRVVEEGTHDELLAAGGLYGHLYRLQFGGHDEKPGS